MQVDSHIVRAERGSVVSAIGGASMDFKEKVLWCIIDRKKNWNMSGPWTIVNVSFSL